MCPIPILVLLRHHAMLWAFDERKPTFRECVSALSKLYYGDILNSEHFQTCFLLVHWSDVNLVSCRKVLWIASTIWKVWSLLWVKPLKSWSGWTSERNQRCHVTGLALTSISRICKRTERYDWGGRGKECEHIAKDCFPFDFRILSLIFEKESHIITCYWPKEITWFRLDTLHPVPLRWD